MKLRAIWQDNSYYSKFLLIIGTVLVSTTLFTIVGLMISSFAYGIPYDQLPERMSDLQDDVSLSIMKIIQSASSIGIFILPALFLATAFSSSAGEFLQLRPVKNPVSFLVIGLMIVLLVPVINLMAAWNETMHLPESLKWLETAIRESEDRAAEITKAFMKMDNSSEMLLNLLIIAVLPAVGEELFFRGILQRVFSGWLKNKHAAIWLTAVIFSAMHAQFYGFIPRMMLGGLLGYLLVWSGSIWAPIFAHFVNNGSAVYFTYLQSKKVIGFNADEVGAGGGDLLLVLICGLSAIGLIYLLRNRLFTTTQAISS